MIRDYRNSDLPELMDIANRAWQPIYDMFSDAYGEELFSIVTRDRSTGKGEQIRNHCASHPEWVYVCEAEGTIVGFVTFLLDRDRGIGTIGNNARDPLSTVKGIGQEMYGAVLTRFRQEGMKYAKVTTGMDDAHGPARRAYERAGFDISHQDITYYQAIGN